MSSDMSHDDESWVAVAAGAGTKSKRRVRRILSSSSGGEEEEGHLEQNQISPNGSNFGDDDLVIGPTRSPTDDEDGSGRMPVINETPTSGRNTSSTSTSSTRRSLGNSSKRNDSVPPATIPEGGTGGLSSSSTSSTTGMDKTEQLKTSRGSSFSSPEDNHHHHRSGSSSKEASKVSSSSGAKPQPKPRKFGIMTSTPLVTGPISKFMSADFSNLNMTAIPEKPRFDVSLEAIDEPASSNDIFQNTSNANTSAWRNKKDDSNEDDKSEEALLPPSHRNKQRNGFSRSASSSKSYDEDEMEEVEKISLADGNKTFNFKKKTAAASADISANFDVDFSEEEEKKSGSVGEDSDIQEVYNGQEYNDPFAVGQYGKASTSSDDDLQVLTEKLQQLPIGKKRAEVEKPRKAIFLNEAPPIERKTYSYDPLNQKHEEFYGDVRRTVTMLGKSIEEMPMPDDDVDLDDILPKGLVPLYDHQKYGLRWLTWRESQFPGGGILADEMGLGKTIMIIALIMKSKLEGQQGGEKENQGWIDQDTNKYGNYTPSQTTLVVCPMGCLHQWAEEIASKGKGLRVATYHGPKKITSPFQLAQYDVVLSTYGTIGSEISKQEDGRGRSPLGKIYWKRIVLDEAHNIRNPKTLSAAGAYKLAARHRWAVTGTPVHNTPEDFFSMVKFLRMVPFDDPKVWDLWIGLKKLKSSNEARARLHTIGTALIIRRTKDEVHQAGGNVKQIPPKTVEVIRITPPEEENSVYQHLIKYAKEQFKNFLKNKQQRDNERETAAMTYTAASKKKNKNQLDGDEPQGDIKFSHLFALIIRLRQCAVLPSLIKGLLEDEDVEEDASFDEDLEKHIFSKRNPIFDEYYESAKIKRILDDVEELREQAREEGRHMDKVIIVSSWSTLLRIIEQHLNRRKISTVMITGKEDAQQRRDAQKAFNRGERRPQVALLSLMAGGVGLNLVGGNYVFFIEPHWNPQLELQAQDRAHRFGQEKDVFIRRYITAGSIEDRILELQEMKMNLADGVLNSNKTSSRGLRGGGLSVAQMQHLFNL